MVHVYLKRAVTAALGVSVVAATAACGTTNSSGSGSAKKISFAFWGSADEAASWKAIVKAFEQKNSGETIVPNWIQANYEQKLQTSIAGGTEPNVMLISNTSLAGFTSSFRSVKLTAADYATPRLAQSMTLAGTAYAVPLVAKPKVLALNKDLFRTAGVALPSATTPMTVHEFATTANKLSHGTGKARVFGSAPLWYNGWLSVSGGSFYDAEGKSCTFASPQGIDAANYVIDASRKAHYTPTPEEAQGQDMTAWFAAGRIGMLPDFGPWSIAPFAQLSKPDWTLLPDPGAGEQMEVDGGAISKSASKAQQALATKFLTFASSDPTAQALLATKKVSVGVPVNAAALSRFTAVLPAERNLAAFVTAMKIEPVGVSVKSDSQIGSQFSTDLNGDTAIGSGSEPPAQVLPKLQEACNATLRAGS